MKGTFRFGRVFFVPLERANKLNLESFMKMSNFEIRANNILTAIGSARHLIEDFGYDDDPAEEAVSRIFGMFITWLTACEESRLAGAYTQKVIAQLPVQDDPSWQLFIQPPPTSTLKQRAEALWGIRIAFTHGDGNLNLITNQTSKIYAQNASNQLPGVILKGNQMVLHGGVAHHAIRTIVQLHSVLK